MQRIALGSQPASAATVSSSSSQRPAGASSALRGDSTVGADGNGELTREDASPGASELLSCRGQRTPAERLLGFLAAAAMLAFLAGVADFLFAGQDGLRAVLAALGVAP